MKTVVDILNKFYSILNEGLLSGKEIIFNRFSNWTKVLGVNIVKIEPYCIYAINSNGEGRFHIPHTRKVVAYCEVQNCEK